MPDFLMLAMLVGLGMLIWDCIEVGRNDAANLVNAVFGARVMGRRVAVLIAGIAVACNELGLLRPGAMGVVKNIRRSCRIQFVRITGRSNQRGVTIKRYNITESISAGSVTGDKFCLFTPCLTSASVDIHRT